MKKIIITALKSLVLFTVLCGGIYTFAVTAVGQLFFANQANGSLIDKQIETKKVVIGSQLISQPFSGDNYLHGRPTEVSQLSPVSEAQKQRIEARTGKGSKMPMDLVTASGSGLDPEISVEAAEYQVTRIALARNMKKEDVRAIIKQNVTGIELGAYSTKRVNVLGVNIMLDAA